MLADYYQIPRPDHTSPEPLLVHRENAKENMAKMAVGPNSLLKAKEQKWAPFTDRARAEDKCIFSQPTYIGRHVQ